MICGFDFEAFYGEAGRNFIEVHHIKPLSSLDEEIMIDPEKDLVCVCSNCHRIIHRKKDGVYSLDDVIYTPERQRNALRLRAEWKTGMEKQRVEIPGFITENGDEGWVYP